MNRGLILPKFSKKLLICRAHHARAQWMYYILHLGQNKKDFLLSDFIFISSYKKVKEWLHFVFIPYPSNSIESYFVMCFILHTSQYRLNK